MPGSRDFIIASREVGEMANTAVNAATSIITLPDWLWAAKTQFRCYQSGSRASSMHLNQWTTLRWETKTLRETGTYTSARESLFEEFSGCRSGGGAGNLGHDRYIHPSVRHRSRRHI